MAGTRRKELKKKFQKNTFWCLLSMAHSAWFLFQSQVYLPGDGATYSGLGPLIIHQEEAPREMPTVQSHGGIFLIEVTPSQMTVVETSKQAKDTLPSLFLFAQQAYVDISLSYENCCVDEITCIY